MKSIVIPYPEILPAIETKIQMAPHGVYGPIQLPFKVPTYNGEYDKIWISGYGVIPFAEVSDHSFFSAISKLPRDDKKKVKIGPAFCPLWEAMQAGACDKDIGFVVHENKVGVMWIDVPVTGAVYYRNTFQAWIYPTGEMEVYYEKVYLRQLTEDESSLNGVVGVIDHTGLKGFTCPDIQPGKIEKLALRFIPEESDFIDVEPIDSVGGNDAFLPDDPVIADGDIVERTVYIPVNAGGVDLKIRRADS